MGCKVIVKNLKKIYKSGVLFVEALRGLNICVDEGEVISIIGPSGSGKSTLLNIIGGLDTPSSGDVYVGDIHVSSLSTSQLTSYRRKWVGHIFQRMNLIPTLTAAENVELPMLAAGMPRKVQIERSRMLLEAMGLSGKIGHKPNQLSGGEQQRVAVAVALANNPPLILADEPTGELDTKNAKVVTDFLIKVNRKFGTTILIVTHDPNVARMCDRMLLIEDGIIKEEHRPTPVDLSAMQTFDAKELLQSMLADVQKAILELDCKFREGMIDGDEYVDRRIMLRHTRMQIENKLHKMAIV